VRRPLKRLILEVPEARRVRCAPERQSECSLLALYCSWRLLYFSTSEEQSTVGEGRNCRSWSAFHDIMQTALVAVAVRGESGSLSRTPR
jgi:hypothetical protein